jgi:hypothetical protein
LFEQRIATRAWLLWEMQQLARDVGVNLLVTQAVARHLDARFDLEPRGSAALRGIQGRLSCWRWRAWIKPRSVVRPNPVSAEPGPQKVAS